MVQMRTCTHAPAPPKLIQMESVFKYSFLVRRSSASCIQSSNQFHRKNKNKMETRIFTGSPHTDKRSSLEHLELGTRVHFTCVHTRAQRTVITEIKCLASSCEPAHSANASVGSSEISKKLVFFPRSPFLFRRDDDLLPHIYFNMFLHFIISRYSLSIPLCLPFPLLPSLSRSPFALQWHYALAAILSVSRCRRSSSLCMTDDIGDAPGYRLH